MKVVSNASPLRYLIFIKHADLLRELFGEILIPTAVRVELTDAGTPETVRQWMRSTPAWLKIMLVSAVSDHLLSRLHRGEQDAILLGVQVGSNMYGLSIFQNDIPSPGKLTDGSQPGRTLVIIG